MNHATVALDALPRPFGTFEHPDVAKGRRMQIMALNIDERRRRLRLDLAHGTATANALVEKATQTLASLMRVSVV